MSAMRSTNRSSCDVPLPGPYSAVLKVVLRVAHPGVRPDRPGPHPFLDKQQPMPPQQPVSSVMSSTSVPMSDASLIDVDESGDYTALIDSGR
jgi:hypothetical protein